ncbi:type I restriction enzyme M protein [Catalinimonas alkaloidigena]|uniref:type I restriction-modification system subunit M n=1 Tax=Catalinimonas alkaloidigena TaxID=1075417 RepID=UPI0024075DC3|nr:class I SAM-dependent DNA methyltransferase [Catalinimonas alkaloidigena]MDF9801298.1 type I restriction enzyme M protein [Catalinimonas alkaloidigena]
MTQTNHSELVGFIWKIADLLRGPYRPPQYRRVMLPMIVLRRMDLVLEDTKEEVLKEYEKLIAQGYSQEVIDKILGNKATGKRVQPLYNTSPFTFRKLLADPDNLSSNLVAYIKGFSPKAREIFEKFDFEKEIEVLEQNNRLFLVVKGFTDPNVNLHPDRVSNLQMGYVFEELVRKFNEQANEEAGDHFTPREVIRLMAHLIYTSDEDVYQPGIARKIYDPTCGTGGMLSVSEEYIREHNQDANLILFGQEYNAESYAICCSDLLIKDEPVERIVFGDTLGDGRTGDGHPFEKFHYMLANPPFGVEWKNQQNIVVKEHETHGFKGRFGPGTPRINDGALLFLLHMISKMNSSPENGGEGSKIAIVFNGSPLFTGDAGSGESNTRRWIIENDWLDSIVALPDQLFYNTGIYTYIWLVNNRKPAERKGKVQLIDATRHYQKMRKSLGNKRNELSTDHINEITRLYGDFKHEDTSKVKVDNEEKDKVCSKIFDNREFGYLKVTVERPLRLNFQLSQERIRRLEEETAFKKLAESKKKDPATKAAEIKAGEEYQANIMQVLQGIKNETLYQDREVFDKLLTKAFRTAGVKISSPIKKAILSALSERDPEAKICTDSKGNAEPDTDLRDTELIPLPGDIPLPLPLDYDSKADNTALVSLVKAHCEAYMEQEVLPHVPDAWIDYSKTKVGYEIPINRHFYVYEPPRDLTEIETEMLKLEEEMQHSLKEIVYGSKSEKAE